MANSYTQLHIHAVFAVKYRNAVIEKSWRTELLGVIGNLINEKKCKTLIVNAVEDHVHCLFALNPNISIDNLMQNAMGFSAKFVNDNKLTKEPFEWQNDYGAFSCGKSHLSTVFKYIQNQEEHHKTQTLREEYIELLTKDGVELDEKYLFEELI